MDEYRVTACLSVLKIVVDNDGFQNEHVEAAEDEESGSPKHAKKRRKVESVPVTLVEKSLLVAQQYLRSRTHEDIDEAAENEVVLTEPEWDQFLQWYYLLAHERSVVAGGAKHLVAPARAVLLEVQCFLPQLEMDGTRNVWIVKPGAKSRGRGIQVLQPLVTR